MIGSLSAYYIFGNETDLNTLITYWDSNYTNESEEKGGSHCEPDQLDPICRPDFCHFGYHDMYVIGFLGMLVVAFGFVANAFNARIFTHKFMRNSLLNWYYAALSISDFLILLSGLVRDIMPRLSDYAAMGGRVFQIGFDADYTAYGAYSFASTLVPGMHAIGCFAQTASVYLTVAMSAHRFVGVCFPFKAHRICTKLHTRILIGSVIAFALVFNMSRFFEVTTHQVECNGTNITESWPRELRMRPDYKLYYIGWAYFIVMYFIPFSLLIGLNLKVILAIRNTASKHRRMSVGDGKTKEQSKERSTSIMLVGVVIVFLVCNTPGFVANVMEVLDLITVNNADAFSKVVDYTNLLTMVNASINCFVYLSFSDKYRALLKHYLSCGCFMDSQPLVDQSQPTSM